jgi:hypothetical protein
LNHGDIQWGLWGLNLGHSSCAARAAARVGPRPATGGSARALRSSPAMAREWGCDLGRALAPGEFTTKHFGDLLEVVCLSNGVVHPRPSINTAATRALTDLCALRLVEPAAKKVTSGRAAWWTRLGAAPGCAFFGTAHALLARRRSLVDGAACAPHADVALAAGAPPTPSAVVEALRVGAASASRHFGLARACVPPPPH